MGRLLPRRFLNLIVAGRSPGIKTLRRIDLTRTQLFYENYGSENPAAAGSSSPSSSSSSAAMETTIRRFSGRSYTFRAVNNEWQMDCFPITDYSECNLLCADQSGRGFVFDLDSSQVSTIPSLRSKQMRQPISVFVHKPHIDGDPLMYRSNGSGLFVMDKFPRPEQPPRPATAAVAGGVPQESEQFVGFIKGGGGGSWQCQLLQMPPFVPWEYYHGGYQRCTQITAYGVVVGEDGGSHVCVSVDGEGAGVLGAGTYLLDTESLTWSRAAGKWSHWTLPFCGKLEYVPEFKLWFGFSDDDGDDGRLHLAAADLSEVLLLDSAPSSSSLRMRTRWRMVVGGPWKELVGVPEEWEECKDPQFVSLGSGRFCIARFFFSKEAEATTSSGGYQDQVVNKNFTVLTGVEVNRSTTSDKNGTGKVELQMTPHRSIRVNNISIETLF